MDSTSIHIQFFGLPFLLLFCAGFEFYGSDNIRIQLGGMLISVASLIGMIVAGSISAVFALLLGGVLLVAVVKERLLKSDLDVDMRTRNCPHCGRENSSSTPICPRCNSRLKPQES